MRKQKISSPEIIAYTALLVALQVVLGNALQIPLTFKQFHIGFLPIAAAGALLGPIPAMIVGGLGDFFGAHLFPAGAYFFGFTVSNMLVGLLYALLLYRQKPCVWRAIGASLAVAVCYLFLNSYWLSILYASRAYWGWVGARWWTYLIEIPLASALIYFTLRGLGKVKLPVFTVLAHHGEFKDHRKKGAKETNR